MGLSGLDSHKAFTVSYQLDGDRELAYHFDNAEVTLNVCLGTCFTGGELSFGPMAGVSSRYSGTSDKGPSEIGTASLQRTLVSAHANTY